MMVDILNCLLKKKDILEEVNTTSDKDGWRSLHEHPLSAATSALLNVSNTGSATEDQPIFSAEDYDKLDKMEKNYTSTPGVYTIGNSSQMYMDVPLEYGISLPLALSFMQSESLRKGKLLEDISQLDLENCLKGPAIKQEDEALENVELIIPNNNNNVIQLQKSPIHIAPENLVPEQPLTPPLQMIVNVKQEQISPMSEDKDGSSPVITSAYSHQLLAPTYESLANAQYAMPNNIQYNNPSPNVYMLNAPPDYRDLDFYTEQLRQNLSYGPPPTGVEINGDVNDATASFVNEYIRASSSKQTLTLDLPSPDSGISDMTVTSRENSVLPQVQMFDYEYTPTVLPKIVSVTSEGILKPPTAKQPGSSRRAYNEYGRHPEVDRVQIPKLFSDVGFKYYLETPISTTQRKEDDRMSYINKGQFYTITLDYVPDMNNPLKSPTVRSLVMLMFREEKPGSEELKAWQFWHSRQHSARQRILDADTKNSTGIIGQIVEYTHNALTFYWNPLEGSAKVNIAVQCLSTDFSNQKGVKGLPLHLQIDTFDEESETPHHRAYCQIKVFCDKGAERKTRDEERRAAKRKLALSSTENAVTFPGHHKLEDMYHAPCERSEFYTMSDTTKKPILFTPNLEVRQAEIPLFPPTSNSFILPGSNLLCKRERQDSGTSEAPTPPPKKPKTFPEDRVVIYARRDVEEPYKAIYMYPPTLAGLAKGLEEKYNIDTDSIRHYFKVNQKGEIIQLDDDIRSHYQDEDSCTLEFVKVDEKLCDIKFIED